MSDIVSSKCINKGYSSISLFESLKMIERKQIPGYKLETAGKTPTIRPIQQQHNQTWGYCKCYR